MGLPGKGKIFLALKSLFCGERARFVQVMKGVKEKRKHPRFEMEVPVTLRNKGKLIPAASLNLSAGGICVLTDFNEVIQEGETEVVVDLPPKFHDVSLRGNILRYEKGIGQKVAIQFTKSSQAGRKTLQKFLANF